MTPDAKRSFDDLKKEVIDAGLCTHCGTCSGVCPLKSIKMEDIYGECVPVLSDGCNSCSLCYETCPGRKVDFNRLNDSLFGRQSESPLGVFKKIYVGSSADRQTVTRAAGGGAVTEILQYLLRGRVDAVVVMGFDENDPSRPVLKIASSAEEVLSAAGSKYCIYPVNKYISEIASSGKRYALVTLPCQTHGLRKAQEKLSALSNIEFVIGIYCGNNLYYRATKNILKKFSMKKVRKISYRYGKWPGGFAAESASGNIRNMSKTAFNYLSFLYTPRRCFYCVDLANELADLSVGDAWDYPEKSVIICRSPRAAGLMAEMTGAGKLEADEISPEEAVLMHAHGLDNKKTGAVARMKIAARQKKAVPDYGDLNLSVPPKRFFRERILMFFVNIGRLEIVRFVMRFIPVSLLEILMGQLRSKWIKTSQKKILMFTGK